MKSKTFAILGIGAILLALWSAMSHVKASSQQNDVGRSSSAPAATSMGHLSISAAAFTAYQDGYDYVNTARHLVHNGGPQGWYLAPVYLPQGATVTRVTFHWYDNSTSNGLVRMQRTQFGLDDFLEMAYAASSGSPGYGSSEDTSIAYDTIDNTQYAYWVVWDIPATDQFRACGVVIEYSY